MTFQKTRKSVRFERNIPWNTVQQGYNVFDTKPPSKSDGLVTIERPLFTSQGALNPYTMNKTDDENDQDS